MRKKIVQRLLTLQFAYPFEIIFRFLKNGEGKTRRRMWDSKNYTEQKQNWVGAGEENVQS